MIGPDIGTLVDDLIKVGFAPNSGPGNNFNADVEKAVRAFQSTHIGPNLIPLVIDAALGRRPALEVYGDDYPTPDGTCIRDYVHVTDLADAHLLALHRLEHGSTSVNLGNGAGHSVLEVIEAVERVSQRKVPYRISPRRSGDPAVLVASSERARLELGWQPRLTALDEIVRTALQWREAHPNGYVD